MATVAKPPPNLRTVPLEIPRVPLNGRVILAEDGEIAAEIAAGAEIDIPVLMGIIALLGVLYSAKYLLIPMMKLAKFPGTNFFSDAVNFVLGTITAPIKSFAQWIKHQIALGIEHHSRPFARTVEGWAHIVHDTSVEMASMAVTTAESMHRLRHTILPREIRKQTAPLRKRIRILETVRAHLDAIAHQYGYADFPTLVKTATPHIKQLVAADIYVESQKHKSLAGALSVYEAAAKSWNQTVTEVRKLGYYTIPDFIRYTETQIEHVIKPELQRQRVQIGKITGLLAPDRFGIPTLLAIMAPSAIARFFRPAIPSVCTEVGDCAASNLVGKTRWNFFKDILGLLLATTLDGLLLADLCTIAKGAQLIAQEISGPLRELVVVEGGLIGIGCAGPKSTLPPPRY